jgi:hypothetical protein
VFLRTSQLGSKLWLHMSMSGSCAAGWSGPLTLNARDVVMASAQPDEDTTTCHPWFGKKAPPSVLRLRCTLSGELNVFP